VAVVVGAQPAADRLGREAAIRERDDERPSGPQDARDLREDLDRPRQVVDRDAAGDGIERRVGETR